MAGVGRRGPAKGSGGRPRTKTPAANDAGYPLTSVGPPGHGKRELAHRVIAFGGTIGGAKVPPASSGSAKTGIVNHLNRVRSDDSKSNLQVTTKSVNNEAKYRTPHKTKPAAKSGPKSDTRAGTRPKR